MRKICKPLYFLSHLTFVTKQNGWWILQANMFCLIFLFMQLVFFHLHLMILNSNPVQIVTASGLGPWYSPVCIWPDFSIIYPRLFWVFECSREILCLIEVISSCNFDWSEFIVSIKLSREDFVSINSLNSVLLSISIESSPVLHELSVFVHVFDSISFSR